MWIRSQDGKQLIEPQRIEAVKVVNHDKPYLEGKYSYKIIAWTQMENKVEVYNGLSEEDLEEKMKTLCLAISAGVRIFDFKNKETN